MSLGTVLVTGGCGCLGHHIVKQLVDGKHARSVTVLARRPDKNLIEGVEYFKGDITNRSEVESVFAKVKPNVVFHTAASMATTSSVNTFAMMESINIEGTRILIEASHAIGTVRAFVYSSSPSIVHSGLLSHPLTNADESLPVLRMPEQHQEYSHTKGIAETIVLESNGVNGVYTVSIRPAGLIGEGDLQTTKGSIERALAGKANTQIGDNTNSFDVTYVGNAAEAHILAAKILMRDPLPTGDMKVDGEAFNITNGDPRPFWDVVRMFAAAAGRPVAQKDIKVVPVGFMFFIAAVTEWLYWIFTFGTKQPILNRKSLSYTIMQRTFSIEKAKKRLGYKATVSLQEGMERGVAWYNKTFQKH
ncbi:hydroxysteroid dehydrogenase [Thozetella sp. PMI_491]|nr:hydroxysteroid dehydrogenase [Thozetella sp. PMI_491]